MFLVHSAWPRFGGMHVNINQLRKANKVTFHLFSQKYPVNEFLPNLVCEMETCGRNQL